jgi:hypothetical protein
MQRTEPAGRGTPPPGDAERVPVFGTWPRIYLAVVVVNLTAILLSALFTRFPY